MKKSLFFAAAAIVAMASCTNDEFIGNSNNAGELAINFGSQGKAITRADKVGAAAAALLDNNFVVYADKTIGTDVSNVFNYYSVNYYDGTANSTASNTNDWEYVGQTPINGTGTVAVTGATAVTSQTIKYWDMNADKYDFVAFSQGKGLAPVAPATDNTYATFSTVDLTNAGSTTDPVYTVTGKVGELTEAYIADLITVKKADFTTTVVTPKFRHLGAKVRVAMYETVPGYAVKDVKFYADDLDATAAGTNAVLFADDKELTNPAGEGSMAVYFPVVGDDETVAGYNDATVVFTKSGSAELASAITFPNGLKFAGSTDAETKLTATDKYIGTASNTATYATDDDAAAAYMNVLPTGEGHKLTLKVDYTLVAIDKAESDEPEEIKVTGATAVVPAVYTNWQPNYAYTYIFKISEDSGEGLYPITFDAVVVDDEIDGQVQETITEVLDPSITTYQKGIVVTANDEYKAGNIYVVAENGVELTPGTNANLYTVTIETGALQTINEKTVANALKNGKQYQAVAEDADLVVGNTYYTDAKGGGKFEETAEAHHTGVAADTFFEEVTPTTSWTVLDANNKALTVTLVASDAADKLTAITAIPATDAPHGVAATVNGAVFTAAASTIYAFEYDFGGAAEKPAKYDEGVVLAAETSLAGYYTYDESTSTYTACADDEEADGATTYYKQIKAAVPAQAAGKFYKVIKVAE